MNFELERFNRCEVCYSCEQVYYLWVF